MPPLLFTLVCDKVKSAPMPFFIKPIARAIAGKVMDGFVTPNLKSQLDFMEAELTKHKWLAGSEFSAADVQMSFPLEAAAQRAGLDASRPKLMAFLKRIHARPAYKRALADRVEPAMQLLKQAWAAWRGAAWELSATAPQDRVVVLRVLAHRVEPAMQLFKQVWAAWRGAAWQLDATPPRLWRT